MLDKRILTTETTDENSNVRRSLKHRRYWNKNF